MQPIKYLQTDDTPEIVLDKDRSIYRFKGESFPENTFAFYDPIIEWIKEAFEEPVDATFDLCLVYISSSSLRVFFEIFAILDTCAQNSGCTITVNWIYDPDNDIALEIGEDFDQDYKSINFVYKEQIDG